MARPRARAGRAASAWRRLRRRLAGRAGAPCATPARRCRRSRGFGSTIRSRPQHPFPAARWRRAFQALDWLHAQPRRTGSSRKSGLFVAGEEAGGNLAAALALMARDQQAPPLAGQILLSPMLDPCMATCSIRQAEAGPVGCKWADGWHQYLGSRRQGGPSLRVAAGLVAARRACTRAGAHRARTT